MSWRWLFPDTTTWWYARPNGAITSLRWLVADAMPDIDRLTNAAGERTAVTTTMLIQRQTD
jgi:hypothetical protein